MPAYRWILAATLFLAAGLNYADRTSISVVFPLLKSELGISDLALGGLGSAFLWAYAIGSPLAGALADRWHRGRVLLSSLVLWSLITAATGLASGYWQLAGSRVALGLAECLYLPAATAMLAQYHAPATRGLAMGLHSAGLNLGLIAGGVAAGYLGDHYGWRQGFFLLGGAGIVLAAFALPVFLRPPSPEETVPAAVREARPLSALPGDLQVLASIPSFWILALKSMLVAIGTWIFFNWLPLYFRETYQLSLTASGFTGTVSLQLAATIGVLGGGAVSDACARRGQRYRMLFQSSCYLLSAPFLLAFLGKPSVAMLSVAVFCFALLRGLGQANENPLICEVVPERLRSSAIGVTNLFNTLSGGTGVLLAGFLKRDFSLGGIFAAIAVLMLAASALLWFGYRYVLARDLERSRTR
ncbi:MAG: MFS transporter [Bryobacterales bacterium]|nr:MFS transporter [Bryobacterales bacterium]